MLISSQVAQTCVLGGHAHVAHKLCTPRPSPHTAKPPPVPILLPLPWFLPLATHLDLQIFCIHLDALSQPPTFPLEKIYNQIKSTW